MDPLTHALTGFSIGHALRPRGAPVGVVVGVTLTASLLPDIDALLLLAGPDVAMQYRRTITHSVLGMPVLAAMLAWIVNRWRPALTRAHAFALSLTGMLAHVVLDLINAYGVALLSPLSARRFEAPLVFVIDPALTVIGLLTLLALRRAQAGLARQRVARIGLVACVGYLGICGLLRQTAQRMLDAQSPPTFEIRTAVIPEPFGPLRWKALASDGETHHEWLASPLTGSLRALPPVRSDAPAADVRQARQDRFVRSVEADMRFPVWTLRCGVLSLHDRRFRYATLGIDWDPFGVRLRRDAPDGAFKMVPRGNAGVFDEALRAIRRQGPDAADDCPR